MLLLSIDLYPNLFHSLWNRIAIPQKSFHELSMLLRVEKGVIQRVFNYDIV